jgi:hypothetical protein
VRESGGIVSAAVIIAVGVNSDGRREVIGPSEAETFWTAFQARPSWPARRQARRVRRARRHQGGDSPRCRTPPGNAAACTSCAMCWRTRDATAAAWWRPSSARPSSRRTPTQQGRSGANPLIRTRHGRHRFACRATMSQGALGLCAVLSHRPILGQWNACFKREQTWSIVIPCI